MELKMFEPIKFSKFGLKNRIVMSPMITVDADEKLAKIHDFHNVHYGARALGGVGLIMLEATGVSSEGRITDKDLGLWNEEQAEALKGLVELLHYLGSKVGVQLNHAGRKSNAGQRLIAPSAISYDESSKTPEKMSLEDINYIVNCFSNSAKFVQESGADIIELHIAHGYLLNQFISPLTNKRDDEYGGSLKNRYRIIKRVITEVKKVFTGVLWARISADEYDINGNKPKDFIQFAKWLKEDGIELIDVSSGGITNKVPQHIYPAYQVPLATMIKRGADIKVSAVGLLNSPQLVESILQSGQADMVSLGRPLLSNPNWLLNAAREFGDLDKFKAFNSSYERGKRI